MSARKKNGIYEVWQHSYNRKWFVSDEDAGSIAARGPFKTRKEAEEAADYLVFTKGDKKPRIYVKPAKRVRKNNPRGKHMSCGSLSAKKCRQLQHVYESARDRGFSKKRAAKQAWGAVGGREYNPRKKNAFMVPSYQKDGMYEIETVRGESALIEAWLVGKFPTKESFRTYFPEHISSSDKVKSFRKVKGWFVQLSAPGYMDQTEWSGPFKTEAEARKFVEDHYEVDPDTGDELEYEENPRKKNPSVDIKQLKSFLSR